MKTNLDAAITAVSIEKDSTDQLASIAANLPAAGTTFVSCKYQLEQVGFGFKPVPASNEVPMFKEAIGRYITSIRGREIVGLYLPGTVIDHDFTKAMDLVVSQRLQNVYGFYAKQNKADYTPKLFILTNVILNHIFNEIPFDLPFYGNGWADWLHDKLTKFMQPHRYLDVTSLGFVKTPALPVPDSLEAVCKEIELEIPVVEQKPVKAIKTAKKRKPKKSSKP